MPTQGGFEESTNLSMPKVQVARRRRRREWRERSESQGFAYLYRDRRRGKFAVVDNTFSVDRPVDITIATVGGSHARVRADAVGRARRSWRGEPCRLASGTARRIAPPASAIEAGHRWTRAPLRPWLRAGYLWASGDARPARRPARHVLPDAALVTEVRAVVGLRADEPPRRVLQAWIEPRRFSARIEVHRVSLASGRDLWYQGSGATASHGRFFGFSGRAAGGDTSLGTVLEGTVDVPIRKYWSVNGYAGTMWGGGVVTRMFTSKRLTFWSLENVIRF